MWGAAIHMAKTSARGEKETAWNPDSGATFSRHHQCRGGIAGPLLLHTAQSYFSKITAVFLFFHTMHISKAAALGALISAVCALDCLAKELADYDFKALKGVYNAGVKRNTPPSITTTEWNFGVCQNTDGIANCPKNADICGVTSVVVEKGKPIITEIIAFGADVDIQYKPFVNEGPQDENGLLVSYLGVTWGDAQVNADVRFICPKKDDKLNDLDHFVLDKWNGDKLEASVVTKAACKRESAPGDSGSDDPVDNGELWGWFTWIFIFLVLFLSIYIVGGAWFQYNKGNAIDFLSALREVLDNFVDLLRGLPAFIKEVVERVTGNTNRGEYSAV